MNEYENLLNQRIAQRNRQAIINEDDREEDSEEAEYEADEEEEEEEEEEDEPEIVGFPYERNFVNFEGQGKRKRQRKMKIPKKNVMSSVLAVDQHVRTPKTLQKRYGDGKAKTKKYSIISF